MDARIKKLVDAGMDINLNQDNLDALDKLTDAQVDQLVLILQGLATGGGSLILTDFPSTQPPTL